MIFVDWTFSLFLGVTWCYGFIVRTLFFLPSIYMLIAMRNEEGDDIGPIGILGTFVMIFLIEASVYSNMKAKAQLFYKLQFSE